MDRATGRAFWAFGLGMCICGVSLAADESFVQKAAVGGTTEVAAGMLAQQQGKSSGVKDFGSKMVVDHGKANEELKALAGGKKMSVPGAPDAEHQQALDALKSKTGDGFDKAFKAQMVADHKATIDLFEKEAKDGQDADLKAFAGKTLPALRGHLKMAEALP